jgi:hypothetical protein
MRNNGVVTEAARAYSVAYAAHYSQRDLAMALGPYRELIASHTSTREAGYSRTQVQNIIDAIVPEDERLDAETALALTRIESQSQGVK